MWNFNLKWLVLSNCIVQAIFGLKKPSQLDFNLKSGCDWNLEDWTPISIKILFKTHGSIIECKSFNHKSSLWLNSNHGRSNLRSSLVLKTILGKKFEGCTFIFAGLNYAELVFCIICPSKLTLVWASKNLKVSPGRVDWYRCLGWARPSSPGRVPCFPATNFHVLIMVACLSLG